MSANAAKPPKGNRHKTLKKVITYVGTYRKMIAFSAFLTVLNVLLSLYIPIRLGNAIDKIIGENEVDIQSVIKILAVLSVLVLIGAFIQWIISTVNNKITFEVVRDIRNDAFIKLQKLPLSYIDAHPYGDIVNRIISDAEQFADGLLLGFTQLLSGVLTILGTLAFMLALNAKIALTVVVLTPLSLFIAKFIAGRTYTLFKNQSEIRAEQTSLIDEMIGNRNVVKAYRYENRANNRFDEINKRLSKVTLRAVFFSSLTNPTTRFVNSLVYACVALIGSISCITSFGTAAPFSVGALSALLAYSNQYTKPFNEISGVVTEFQNALACAGRIFELLEIAEEEPDSKDAFVLETPRGEVNLKNVSFSYTPEKELIKNLNLYIAPGKRVAIVGPTGCGKSTLINLLMRFYDVNSGEIEVDGINIKDITRQSLRKSYGMVLQETWLKSGTIRENIAMGKPNATDEEIIKASIQTHADSFIRQLENGYDTVIGEDGVSLSQGQKQLLCITRLMLLYPPMLILDEATSSIDTRTEQIIQKAFLRLMRGKTSFIVAHRLSTIKEADIILVMKDGNIIEKGTHSELIKLKGFYYELYESSFKH